MPLEHGTQNLPKMVDGKTPLAGVFFNLIHGRVDQRLAALEALRISWEEATDLLTRQGLSRIDEVLAPAFLKIEQVLELGFMTAPSVTEQTLGVNNELVFVITEGPRRDLFQPSAFLAITRVATADDYGLARLLSYVPATGTLTVEVISVSGDPGPHSDWEISGLAASTIAGQNVLEQTQGEVAAFIEDAEVILSETRAARDAAGGHVTSAAAQVILAGNAKTAAENARDGAQGYAATTASYRNTAQGYRDEAAGHAEDAEDAAALAATFVPDNFYNKGEVDAAIGAVDTTVEAAIEAMENQTATTRRKAIAMAIAL